jgi:hypothetical protein
LLCGYRAHSVNTGRVLAEVIGTPKDEIDQYLAVLLEMADASRRFHRRKR